MPCERDRLVADAFHQVAVAGDDIGAVVHQRVAEARVQVAFRNRHADSIGDALAERAGGRLNPAGVAVLRMSCARRANFAEGLDVLDRHVRIAGEIEERIKKHRTVTGRQDEPVAVGPMRVGRIEFQEFGEQNSRRIGHAHRQSRMAGFRVLDGVHRKRANRVCQRANPNLFRGLRRICLREVHESCLGAA